MCEFSSRVSTAVLCLIFAAPASAQSLLFHGNGILDIDRVKIPIDDPYDDADQGPPADIGATDFTIEFWVAPTMSNAAGPIDCRRFNWIYGNIVFDRDIYGAPPGFGISLAAGRVTFGLNTEAGEQTICGETDIRDGAWHHVAVQRTLDSGLLEIYVDGRLEASGAGPTGDASYPNERFPLDYCDGPCVNSDPFIVLGAEKHDFGPAAPSYAGGFDELRLSTVRRYDGPFEPPAAPFVLDANTAALYHFDTGEGDSIVDANGNASPGIRRFGGGPWWRFWGPPDGPEWRSETPFGAARD